MKFWFDNSTIIPFIQYLIVLNYHGLITDSKHGLINFESFQSQKAGIDMRKRTFSLT